MSDDRLSHNPRALTFVSSNGQYRITVPKMCVDSMLAHARASSPHETGGIIVGRYTPSLDRAVLTDALGPPGDSEGWASGFVRGIRGLANKLAHLWSSSVRTYYLGEWHFHPFSAARPSGDDRNQMLAIARSDSYRCPEPILLILGGDPNGIWELTAHVYTRKGEDLHLAGTTANTSSLDGNA